jgi:ribosomal protein S18 acetylase RimI-like enzyme
MSTLQVTQVKNAPAIAGLTFRGFAGESDYPKMLAVIEGSKHVDQVERTDSLEDVQRNYSHLTNCDPYTDMLFAEMNGEVIGYQRVWWDKLNDGLTLTYSCVGFLLPEWRRKGIGTAMFQYAEDRMRQIAAAHTGPETKVFSLWANGTAEGWVALLESQGYTATRYFFEMTRDINEPLADAPLPTGLQVRPVTEADYRAVYEAHTEAFRDHWGFNEQSFEEFMRWSEEPDFNPNLWKVAWDGDQIAGQVLNFVNSAENIEYQRKRGYTEAISVRRPWRKRGLARSLVIQSIAMFKEMGMTETALGVDAENPSGALSLYQGLGYKEVRRNMIYRKPL